MSIFDLFKRKPNPEQLRLEKMQTELEFLRSQQNPQFLHATLNHIYKMAYPVSDQVADAIQKLSDLIPYMLADNTTSTVNLQNEVEYLKLYIDLHRLRLGEPFSVDFKTTGDITAVQIAPLILFPFVENALKHGVLNLENRPVRIALQASYNRLTFTVSYKINQTPENEDTIRRRLEFLYPGNYDLMIANNGETYKSTLTIKFTT
ncbi:sensor histidine kinase [Mucilaginibacter agri]|uniref:Signal transduction histidine kinase internal region domain-containing protein n=1 Tax=Mucilaginibacter agri TaxID=2695265 RepID=A0A965ZL90_9SPHI|nr:histidine kinase [Mucilaginibacter agri]NCD71661.1 hypothetical protein [Mucilaginibacter agri]